MSCVRAAHSHTLTFLPPRLSDLLCEFRNFGTVVLDRFTGEEVG